jgi:hypothetical protein
MSRHATRLLAATLILAAATACSSSSHSSTSNASPSPTGKLAAEWTPKLKAATEADTGICNQAGDKACAGHLTDIALVVTDLEDAIGDAGGKAAYPKTTAELAKVDKAVDAYTLHECLDDPNASIEGSPCPDDARTIITGGEALQLALAADEAAG